ncbi:MAG: CoA-binding protein [Candidatus Lokiarchaeota archaeon]|nr:CoA-binding protein [Candidatus Lokiarchaeota archaeon]
MARNADLDMFFKPKSVAVVGVSRTTRKFGHVIFRNFIESNIEVTTYPVNPKIDTILGYKCYDSLLDIPGSIDLVISAVGSHLVLDIVKQCAQKGVRGIIIIAGGFSETGEEGKRMEEEIKRIAKENNIRILGPNIIGIYDPRGVDTLFLPSYRQMRPKKGKIAFISQSGAFGSALLDFATSQGVGMSKFISIGNALDVNAVDALNYLENDKDTKCIMIYMEGIEPEYANEFREALERITVKKPIVLLKGGLTEQGQKAAESHTASISSQTEILQSVLKQSGVIQASDALEVFDMARILAASNLPKGKRIAIITNAGGFGVLTTDQLVQQGFELAKLKDETVDKLQSKMPRAVIIANPTDLVGDADTERYKLAIDKILSDSNVDLLILIILLSVSYVESDVVDVINDAKIKYNKPIIVTTIGGEFTQMMVRMMEANDIPTFPTPQRTVDAVRALVNYSAYCGNKECVLNEE